MGKNDIQAPHVSPFIKALVIVFFVVLGLFGLSLIKAELNRTLPGQEDFPLGKETVFLGTFSHPNPDFSFKYPSDFEVSLIAETKEGKAVVFEDFRRKTGFQVFLKPFTEQIVLTPDRIRQDIPDITLNHLQEIKLSGIMTLFFSSQSEAFGKTYEVWFVHDGYLFQITAPIAEVDTLKKVLVSYQFSR